MGFDRAGPLGGFPMQITPAKGRKYMPGVELLMLMIVIATAISTIGLFVGFKEAIYAAAAILSIVTAVLMIWRWIVNRDEEYGISLVNNAGFPRIDVAIETPDGLRFPNQRGIIENCNGAWNGQKIMIYNTKTWQLLDTRTIKRKKGERIVKVVIENNDKIQARVRHEEDSNVIFNESEKGAGRGKDSIVNNINEP